MLEILTKISVRLTSLPNIDPDKTKERKKTKSLTQKFWGRKSGMNISTNEQGRPKTLKGNFPSNRLIKVFPGTTNVISPWPIIIAVTSEMQPDM